MTTRSKLLLTTVFAALTLALAVNAASANRLSIDDNDFRAIWTRLTFAGDAGVNVTCPVTLIGSFHSAVINKTANNLIGAITTAQVGSPCEGGSATVLTATLPWHVTYQSFSGTLPRITAVRLLLVGASFAIEPGEPDIICLARTTTTEPAAGEVSVNETTGVATQLSADPDNVIDTNDVSPSVACDLFAIDGSFAGTTSTLDDNAGNALVIRLI